MYSLPSVLGVVIGPTDRVVDNDRLCRDVVYHAKVAASLVRGMEPFDARVVHGFVQQCLRYNAELDPSDQRLRMPWRSLRDGVVDCKSSAILIAALAFRAGLDVRLAFIDQVGQGWDHTFAVVEGCPVDPLCDFGKTFAYIWRHDVDLR